MKSLRVNVSKSFAVVGGILLVSGVGAYRAQADTWDKHTVLTVNEPIQVTDRLLQPGTYVLRLLDSNSDRHIVQIFNEDQSHIVDTVLAIPNYRLEPTGNSRFQFWETPPGHAKALRAWFYPGDNFGQEFLYPKHLAAIETASFTMSTRPMTQPEVTTAALAPQPAAQVAQEPAPPAKQPESTTMTQPEVARAEPAPAPVTPEAAAAPEPAPTPAPPPQDPPVPQSSLPKTASSYPVIGIAGIFCLGASALLRGRRPVRS
jgi:hypothetical protein